MARVLKLNSNTSKIPNIEIHEARENNESTWQTRMHRVAVEIASTLVGQAMMMQFYKLLWTLEKTAAWISNGKTDGKRVKAPAFGLVRPLPWVLFLPTLVTLRYTRVILSLISICFGYDEIEASTMVSFLHQSRRTIRHITHEAKRNKRNQVTQNQLHSSIEYAKRIVLSFLSNLSNLISQAPDTIKVHNNKTSLNAAVASETDEHDENDENDQVSSQSDDSDSEDQIYQDFLKRTLDASDTGDEDFVFELNGEDESDTDSQSSVASEDLSDESPMKYPIIIDRRPTKVTLNFEKSTNGNASHNDSNYSGDSSVQPEQNEIASADIHNDAQSSMATNKDADDALNRLIDDTNKIISEISNATSHIPISGTKNINRHHKNGRFHTKTQNNGKHFNGAHAQGKSKSTKNHHVQSSNDIVGDVAADRT